MLCLFVVLGKDALDLFQRLVVPTLGRRHEVQLYTPTLDCIDVVFYCCKSFITCNSHHNYFLGRDALDLFTRLVVPTLGRRHEV